ncbi:hypothetical protein T265_15216, partial [Opisthorchis viverrini]
ERQPLTDKNKTDPGNLGKSLDPVYQSVNPLTSSVFSCTHHFWRPVQSARMYNGIGLPTPRGSGTNGYVQRNLAFISTFKEKIPYKTDDDVKRADAAHFKEPNKEILEHERKRKIEVKCFELEQLMEEQGYMQSEITRKVSAFRASLLEELKAEDRKKSVVAVSVPVAPEPETGRIIPKGTHETAAVNVLKNTVFKEALGIGADFQDGNSLVQANQRREEEMEKKRLLEAQAELKALESSSDESEKIKERTKHRKSKTKKHRKRSPSPSSSEESKRAQIQRGMKVTGSTSAAKGSTVPPSKAIRRSESTLTPIDASIGTDLLRPDPCTVFLGSAIFFRNLHRHCATYV